MSTPCNKFGTKQVAEIAQRGYEEYVRREQEGRMGELIAAATALQRLNLERETFDQISKQGIDSVCRDSNGRLVVIEAKYKKDSPLSSLGQRKLSDEQLSPSWIERAALLMQSVTSKQFSPENAKLGHEIMTVGAENVRAILIHTDKETLVTTTWERQPDGSYKKIDTWDESGG